MAFLALLQSPLSAYQHSAQARCLSLASVDMAVGQALDIEAEGQTLTVAALEQVHRHKTGALIRASVALAAIAAQADEPTTQRLDTYADRLGLAFQVHDDVLDVIGDTTRIGKQAGADAARAKPTYPAILGLSQAQLLAAQLHEEALAALAPLGHAAQPLHDLANFLVKRDH
jgi:geranylgeranyl pyrophosphate synthase